jgi:flagellum-specific peptidoglycan hydrolase FlgJ
VVGRILILAILLTGFTTSDESTELRYIESFQELALAQMRAHGIPASIILAQAVVESDAGRSTLAVRANNHFGIKCKSWWTGGKYFYADDDRSASGQLMPSCFRLYNSAEESFSDHSAFLKSSDRYTALFQCGADYSAWATGLQRCGYATDQRYAKRLIQVIEHYNLHELDKRVSHH